MADEIKVVKTTGLGQNLLNSVVGVLIGILIFFASFVLLYWNEGRADLSLLATTAIAIPADEAPPADASGKLISISGLITTPDKISDGLFLQKAPYLALKREMEMFAWEQTEDTETVKNLGGSTTTTTTYRYQKNWTSNPENSDNFKEFAGHVNPKMPLSSEEFRATTGIIGKYSFELKTAELPSLTPLVLSPDRVNLRDKTVVANKNYLFVPSRVIMHRKGVTLCSAPARFWSIWPWGEPAGARRATRGSPQGRRRVGGEPELGVSFSGYHES